MPPLSVNTIKHPGNGTIFDAYDRILTEYDLLSYGLHRYPNGCILKVNGERCTPAAFTIGDL